MNLGASQKVLNSNGTAGTIAIASTAVVWTRSFPLFLANYFGVFIKASSATGTPDIKVELEESPIELLSTEQGLTNGNWVEPDGADDIVSQINDEVAHIFTVEPTPMPMGRYKITGINANPADTLVTMINFLQENR